MLLHYVSLMMYFGASPQIWCYVCPICPQAHITREANIIRRCRYHLQKANIICVITSIIEKSDFFHERDPKSQQTEVSATKSNVPIEN